MEYIIIFIGCIISILVLYLILNINIFNIKKEVEDKELDEVVNKLPENEEVCKSILTRLNNKDVNIKLNEDSKDKTSLYIVLTNTILIANIKDMYTRIQTIAHECIHSIQNKTMLLFNFIFTNFYNLYYIVLIFLTLLGKINNYRLHITILLLIGFIFYFVRSYLETDAMTRARFIAEDYMNEISNKDKELIKQEEIDKVCKKYDEINKKGIPLYNFILFLKTISKIIIYSILAFVMTTHK